ncbi:MAG: hypothetical protein HQ509_02095 [Candidatus Marinimicrobia bacterium]|nr:hypothetical protein [Candidatus Neomarinimicrobiota bacterium]
MNKYILSIIVTLTLVQALEKTVVGKITYLTSDQVYCDIGRDDGVSIGDTMTVSRRNDEIGKIIVSNLASQSSVCTSLIPITEYQLGDRVELRKIERMDSDIVAQDSIPGSEENQNQARKNISLKHNGNIGLRYSNVSFSTDSTNKRSKRSVSTLQYGLSLNGKIPTSIWVYGRGDMLDKSFTLYQARMTIGDPNSKLSSQIGRVFTSELAGMGATDGLLTRWNPTSTYGLGFILGVQPDPISLAFNPDIRKGGIFGHLRQKYKRTQVSGRAAVVGQYASGNVDREFAVFHLNVGNKRIWDFRTHATVDYYRDPYISTRNSVSLTNSEISLRIRPISSISFSTRYSTNRMIVYRATSQTFVDSLFEDEMRSGWYNSLQYRHKYIGKFNLGTNIRYGSTDRPSTVIRFNYGTGNYLEKSYGDFTVMYMRNFLITGIRGQVGFGKQLGRKGNMYFQYENYSYGYGNLIADYNQQTLSGSLSFRLRKNISISSSLDYTMEPDYQIFYMYFGGSFRF